ncbi:hypothetical protein [Candidatus Enterovibrio altilux]|uniref:hypothetical protein n=1 Tax=Candidatus Enterovibrio altilux TaxID=1927128 RepID=UPI0016806A5D|nr:hypothetical protein [Candidatus Enterovibrio luxaltus]
MLLRGLQRSIYCVFKLLQLPVAYPHYSCISKQTKTVNAPSKEKLQKSYKT